MQQGVQWTRIEKDDELASRERENCAKMQLFHCFQSSRSDPDDVVAVARAHASASISIFTSPEQKLNLFSSF